MLRVRVLFGRELVLRFNRAAPGFMEAGMLFDTLAP
jgi:hypothetical protein